ncbi:MAG: hypothetical protein ABSE73_07425 [Planctomycetota bacterium]
MLWVRAALTLVLVSILCTGCMVQSMNPYYTQNSLVAYPQVVGRWQLVKERGRDLANTKDKIVINPWTIRATRLEQEELEAGLGTRIYVVTSYDQSNREGKLRAIFFTVGDETYCDVTSAPELKVNTYSSITTLRLHLLLKVELKDDVLRLRFIDRQWLQTALESKEIVFPVLGDERNAILLNATSPQWKAFLEKYGKTEGVFSNDNPMELKRIKDEPPAEEKPAEAKPAQP